MSDNNPSSQAQSSLPDQLSQDEKNLAMFCHLAAFAFVLLPALGHLLGPLILWLVKKDASAYIDYHGKESLNFQITMTLLHIVAVILWFVLIGAFLTFGLVLFEIVVVIIAAIKAKEGIKYQYPINFRLIK